MNQKKVLALLLSLCLIVSMTVPVFAAGSRGVSWPWTSSSATVEEEPATTSGGSLVLVEDKTTVTEGTELRASTYVLTNDGSASSVSGDVYTEVDGSTTAAQLASSGETYYYLSDGVYYEVTITKSTTGFFFKRTNYTLTANGVTIATLSSTSRLSSAKITLYTKEAGVSAANDAYAVSTMALTDDATTYAGNNNSSNYAGTSTTLKYFPVTMYNYDKTTINNATHQVEVDNDLGNTWNGIYFNDGNPSAESYTYSTGGQVSYTSKTVEYNGNGNYNTYINNGYYVDVNGTKHLVTGLSCTRDWRLLSGYTYSWTITYDGGTEKSSDSSITLYKASTGSTATTASLSYAAWNFWNKGTGNKNYGQYTYSGLVESTLTANKDITFTKPDGGIFNSDATVKNIYTGVEMPFVYENGTYTFDASQNGVYFYADSTQGSTAAQSNGRLYFNEGKPQSNGGNYGDGSKTVWMPFNSTQSINGEGNCDYHFGMRTTIPFTMTANGRMNPNDNDSEAITFSFSGDDDVWIFIDGQLVIDLGGIHNRLDATINFAENTWSISESNTSDVAVADYNRAAISGTVFNDGSTTGTLNQTRETFAATDSHELTIFYLERGAGSSNCKIQFNLPMKDTLTVKKLVSEKDSAGAALDPDTLASINNRDFGFTLYKGGTPVGNTNYSLLNENGQNIGTPSTDANGHFTLKNGQTAKFVGAISSDANNPDSYYVVEDKDEGAEAFWQVPTWTYTAEVANGATSAESTVTNAQSMTVTATGSDEAEDSIVFTCTNVWVHQDRTSINAVDDKIVIDYGLPVVIDVLANDTVSNGTKSIVSVTGAEYGDATIDNGKIKYQLTKQLTGVEVLTYTAKAIASAEADNKTAEAKVYIIPATSMYYEENFSGLVTFSDGWSNVGTAQTDPQEPGVVGTVGDSPYGSDAAYLNDSGDSNSSSKYVNTKDAKASFKYTFTGTGTSFFARTTSNSGYMRIEVYAVSDQEGVADELVYEHRRDTSYKSADPSITLYNIPVFTWTADNYGTYRVEVYLSGGSYNFYGTDFWLDGIRVMMPMDVYGKYNEEAVPPYQDVAQSAYAADGEANITVVTLREKLLSDASIIGYVDEDGKLIEPLTDESGNIIYNNETGEPVFAEGVVPKRDADGKLVQKLAWDGENFVVFTDTNGTIVSAEEYKSNGPKEEVYLNKGESANQSVTFSLSNWDANTNKIYLGIKAPFGSGTVSINGNSLNINNTTDCYYDISSFAEITTDVDGVKTATFKIEATSDLISVTNIKVTGSVQFTIVDETNVNVEGSDGDDDGSGSDVNP